MGRRSLGLDVACSVGAGAAHALLALVGSSGSHGLLAAAGLALPVLCGSLRGARAGALSGALLLCTQLLSWRLGLLSSQPPPSSFSLALLLLLGPAAGFAVGQLRDRLHAHRAHEQLRAERFALVERGEGNGSWAWELGSNQLTLSAGFRQITQQSAAPTDLLAHVHPEDAVAARAELEAHLRGESERYEHAHRIRRADGSWRWVLMRGMATRDAQGKPLRMAGLLTDIGTREQSEELPAHHQHRHSAFHDVLTGLPNRALFMDRVQHAVARARRAPVSSFAVLLLDLDRFKNVNDSLGHAAGDRLLLRVAERIGACARNGDTVARLGGDEFAVLLEELSGEHEAERIAELIQRSLSAPIPLDGHDLISSASIGIVLARDDAFDALSLLRRAGQAMQAAKQQGGGRRVSFEPSAHESVRPTLEASLRTALKQDELRVYFQPIVNVASGEATGFEALVRWPHPKLGLISPAELLPVAEESGAIVQLGDFVLREALRALHRLEAAFRPAAPFTMAVNLSARELARHDLVSRVERALAEAEVAPSCLVLEVKESALMGDNDAGQAAFRQLRTLGVRVHMDDFGIGYSSLSYLHKFPVDALKIDGSFTSHLNDSARAEEIVRTVITIARDLHLGVIAECVENREQLTRLRELGCQEAQGFLFGAPLPLEALEALLRRGPKLAVA